MPVKEAALASWARSLMVSQHSCESFQILFQRHLLPFVRMRQQMLAETLNISGELGRIRGGGIDKPVTHVSTHPFCAP
jgi:hypothetical protein